MEYLYIYLGIGFLIVVVTATIGIVDGSDVEDISISGCIVVILFWSYLMLSSLVARLVAWVNKR